MRFRTILLILVILLVAAFVALNVDEFTRSSVLSLGFTTVQVPLGMVMLLLLAVTMLVFLATTLYIQSTNLLENRRHAKELNAQRELADKAEASRFTELHKYLQIQADAVVNREAANATVLAERLAQTQTVLMHRLEQSDRVTAAYLGEIEDRLERSGSLASSPLVR